MNDDLRTCDSILEWLRAQTENKNPISPHLYLEAVTALSILSSDENDNLIELEHQLAQFRADEITAGKTAAATRIIVEASPIFKEARKQRSKMKLIEEQIRLGKLRARIKSDEMRNNL